MRLEKTMASERAGGSLFDAGLWAPSVPGRAQSDARGATANVKPVDFGVIFPQSGGLPLPKRAPQRQAYRLVETPALFIATRFSGDRSAWISSPGRCENEISEKWAGSSAG